jgi:hypothetical protein
VPLILFDDVGGAPDRVVGRDVELDEAGTEFFRGSATTFLNRERLGTRDARRQ